MASFVVLAMVVATEVAIFFAAVVLAGTVVDGVVTLVLSSPGAASVS